MQFCHNRNFSAKLPHTQNDGFYMRIYTKASLLITVPPHYCCYILSHNVVNCQLFKYSINTEFYMGFDVHISSDYYIFC